MIKRKDLWMGSTEVEAIKTIGDIQGYLVRMGADRIALHFDEKTRDPIGLYFTLKVAGKQIPYQLPARIEPIFKILNQGRGMGAHEADMAQARRVAWRHIFRWIQAQIAMVETGMVDVAEVFHPYVQISATQTLFERDREESYKFLIAEVSEVQR